MKIQLGVYISALLLMTATAVQAQESFTLNSIDKQISQKAALAENGRVYYQLNEQAFSKPEFTAGAEFNFNLEGKSTDFIITKRTEYFPGVISIIAREKGDLLNTFAFTYDDGRLNGRYHESHDQSIFLNYDVEAQQNYFTSKTEGLEKSLACGLHHDEGTLSIPVSRSLKTAPSDQNKALPQSISVVDDSITIDLMIVYTNAAETWAESSSQGDINGVIAQALNLSQTALTNSETKIELRLVHSHKTSYDETSDGVDSQDRLRRLTQNPVNPINFCSQSDDTCDPNQWDGYMEEVHTLRDEYGADVVSLLANINDTGGLGWRLGSIGGSAHYAFNLNRVQQVANGFTLIHEIGHNMGNVHARTQETETAASESGGLFHYSAGYQNESAGFHTVMAYATTESGSNLTEAPLFSSPDLTWQGQPAGTNDSQTPENNARSMREIKKTVASYRPSIVNSPVASLSTDEIMVEMNREDELSVNLGISNSGESSLMWNTDFDFVPQTISKSSKEKEERKRMEPAAYGNIKRSPANYSGAASSRNKTNLNEEILYSTSFEGADRFSTGSFSGLAEWRALSDSEFIISTDNPNSGSQHLRVESDGSGNTQFIDSPFLGYQQFGEYEVTINFLISNTSEVYDFYILDDGTGDLSSGVIIANQTIYAADNDEQGELSFFSTSASISQGTYYELRIVYNNSNASIDYYLDGNQIAQNEYINGNTPNLIEVVHRNQFPGAYIDVDDIEIKKVEVPYSWLNVDSVSGVTFEGESNNVQLTFNTQGLSSGRYETILKVITNDPDNEEINIPITLDVREAVSNEIEGMPEKISLAQNYPNPFNPTTSISYSLNEARDVKLEVFNIQGQKVATLINENKAAGKHKATFDAGNLSSGIYIYRLQAGAETLTRKMVLIK